MTHSFPTRRSSDLLTAALVGFLLAVSAPARATDQAGARAFIEGLSQQAVEILGQPDLTAERSVAQFRALFRDSFDIPTIGRFVLGRYRSEEHTSELQSLMRTPYAVFCLKQK